jgi:parallel beta-helix repeat protein
MILLSGCIDDQSNNEILDPNKEYSDTIILNGIRYNSIQQAIDASKDNDTIYVYDGTYYENLIINTSINLKGENKENTIIDGNQSNDTIRIDADNVSIQGFKITHAGSTYSSIRDAGIEINSDNNSISECNITLNGYYGIVIYFAKDNYIFNNIFDRNTESIYGYKSTNNIIESNIITNNAKYGMYLFSDSNSNFIKNNIFSYNDNGARIKSSRKNNVSGNEFSFNKKGLYFCCGGRDNIIYLNAFINNTQYNARDDVINTWDNGVFGNYWYDCNCTDSDNDGIGDNPYIITSTEFSDKVDNLPLMINPLL